MASEGKIFSLLKFLNPEKMIYQIHLHSNSLDNQDAQGVTLSHKKKEIDKIPAEIEDALIYRKTTSAGVPDFSLPICEYNNKPQVSTYSFFCSKKNRQNPNPAISLYLQNTIVCIIFISTFILSQLYIILTNRKQKCQNDLIQDCPWLSFHYNFFQVKEIFKNIPGRNGPAGTKYLESIFLGLKIQLGVLLSLFPISIMFVYCQTRLMIKLKRKNLASNAKPCISDYTIMVTRKSDKEVGMSSKRLEEYFLTILNEQGREINSLDISH